MISEKDALVETIALWKRLKRLIRAKLSGRDRSRNRFLDMKSKMYQEITKRYNINNCSLCDQAEGVAGVECRMCLLLDYIKRSNRGAKKRQLLSASCFFLFGYILRYMDKYPGYTLKRTLRICDEIVAECKKKLKEISYRKARQMVINKHTFDKLRKKFTVYRRRGMDLFGVKENPLESLCPESVRQILNSFNIDYRKPIEVRIHKNPQRNTVPCLSNGPQWVTVDYKTIVYKNLFLKDISDTIEFGFKFYISFWQ